MSIVSILLSLLALLLLVPVAVLLVQILVALPSRQRRRRPTAHRPRVAVLVPAHDEALGIVATVRGIVDQLAAGDRVLVVADNCSDDTALLASAGGAETAVRTDPERRGKGYALDFGMRQLEVDPPEVVIVIDADCRLGCGTLDRLARVCGEAGRPVQALYLMHAPSGGGLKLRIAEFAWAVKNLMRPLGYQRLGLPCQLMGTGMAFPWESIRDADLGKGHIVEDLKLGLDLARVGQPPLFCPEALVSSVFPVSAAGAHAQRTRWEHGHLGMILGEAPGLLLRSLARFDLPLTALVLDLCVPPLALLALALGAQVAAGTLVLALGGSGLPLLLGGVSFVLFGLAVLLAWFGCGRNIVSFGDLVTAPLYALSKIPLYCRFVIGRQVEWVRSRRDGS